MKQAIIKMGDTVQVYYLGKLIGTVKTEDEAWELLKKIKEGAK